MMNNNKKIAISILVAGVTLVTACTAINRTMEKTFRTVPRTETGMYYENAIAEEESIEPTPVMNYIVEEEIEVATTPQINNFVFKPSTHYIHRDDCVWVNSECYYVDSYEDINDPEAKLCEDCNPEFELPETGMTNTEIPVTDYEYVLLCNLVAGEYGSDWVSTYDKGAVVATVIHRMWEGTRWTYGAEPTIENVIAAPYQYDGKYISSDFAWNVTEDCKKAVTYALNNIEAYDYFTNPDGTVVYMTNSFYGDGTYNWFSTK